MAFLRFTSSRSFRRFRVAAFGVTTFLRLGWGFIIALNAFSLTTRLNLAQYITSTYLFTVNALVVLLTFFVGAGEAWRFSTTSWASQTMFEIGWLTIFTSLEIVGAVMMTLNKSKLKCDYILRLSNDNSPPRSEPGMPPGARASTEREHSTCEMSNMLAFYGIWVIIGISVLYAVWFNFFAWMASRRDTTVWRSQVNSFDWSLSWPQKMNDEEDPTIIRRPSNPMCKDTPPPNVFPTPPIFIDPFLPNQGVGAFNAYADNNNMHHSHQSMNRHQIISHYHAASYSSGSTDSRAPSWARPLTLCYPQQEVLIAQEDKARGALQLEGVEPLKRQTQLSICIPEGNVTAAAAAAPYSSLPLDGMDVGITSPATDSEEAYGGIARAAMRPFGSASSLESVPSSENASGRSSTPATEDRSRQPSGASHSATLSHTAPHYTVHAPYRYKPVQPVAALQPYPEVQVSDPRRSTAIASAIPPAPTRGLRPLVLTMPRPLAGGNPSSANSAAALSSPSSYGQGSRPGRRHSKLTKSRSKYGDRHRRTLTQPQTLVEQGINFSLVPAPAHTRMNSAPTTMAPVYPVPRQSQYGTHQFHSRNDFTSPVVCSSPSPINLRPNVHRYSSAYSGPFHRPTASAGSFSSFTQHHGTLLPPPRFPPQAARPISRNIASPQSVPSTPSNDSISHDEGRWSVVMLDDSPFGGHSHQGSSSASGRSDQRPFSTFEEVDAVIRASYAEAHEKSQRSRRSRLRKSNARVQSPFTLS